MQAILDEVCLARQYPLRSPQREDLAFRLIALYHYMWIAPLLVLLFAARSLQKARGRNFKLRHYPFLHYVGFRYLEGRKHHDQRGPGFGATASI